MQIVGNVKLREVLQWTRHDIYYLLVLASVPTFFYYFTGWKWLSLPWLPIALIGTAVTFIVSFKNNASYDRNWEAREIWGGIVNNSRDWATSIIGYIKADVDDQIDVRAVQRRLINRHIAWLTALRYQLREAKPWEVMDKKYNAEYAARFLTIEEHANDLPDVLKRYLPEAELERVLKLSNKPAQILVLQTEDLRSLHALGLIDNYKHVELQNVITELHNQQGGSERIKNFPYPRQYATLNLFYVRIFTFLLPFGMLPEFERAMGANFVWLTIPLTALAGWIFTTMEKVGEASENPFEGGANDIPITQISRNIEIDLLQMLGERDVPSVVQPSNGVIL